MLEDATRKLPPQQSVQLPRVFTVALQFVLRVTSSQVPRVFEERKESRINGRGSLLALVFHDQKKISLRTINGTRASYKNKRKTLVCTICSHNTRRNQSRDLSKYQNAFTPHVRLLNTPRLSKIYWLRRNECWASLGTKEFARKRRYFDFCRFEKPHYDA